MFSAEPWWLVISPDAAEDLSKFGWLDRLVARQRILEFAKAYEESRTPVKFWYKYVNQRGGQPGLSALVRGNEYKRAILFEAAGPLIVVSRVLRGWPR